MWHVRVQLTGVKCYRGSLTYQTRFPHPLGRTVTLVAVNQVLAGASVVARVRSAVVNIWMEGIRFRSFLKIFWRLIVAA